MAASKDARLDWRVIAFIVFLGLGFGSIIRLGFELLPIGGAFLHWAKPKGAPDRQAEALLEVLAAAIENNVVLVKTVTLGRVEERIEGGRYIAFGRLVGRSDDVFTREWSYTAHLTRLCAEPRAVCWRLDSMTADYTMLYPVDEPSPSTYLKSRIEP